MFFPKSYSAILQRMNQADPLAYGRTRNYLNGHITRLSPYISRGVISVKQVLESVLVKGYRLEEIEPFVKELAWREYFQRTWQHLEDGIFEDIRIRRTNTSRKNVPVALLNATTGIEAVDTGIRELVNTGYMHNHMRMYTASIACNIGQTHWPEPARWMYYHLLDGDLASNTCSWQWVSGQFSNKQYYCNQENINKYTGSKQRNSFLDKPYADLPGMEIPASLQEGKIPEWHTPLPETTLAPLDPSLPLLLYNSYNLDPEWRKNMKANRVLLLEPSHFRQFPVSSRVIQFITALGQNIPGLQVFCGELASIPGLHQFPAVYSKEHPAFRHYPGIKDERDWIFPATGRFYDSFFQFWKQQEKFLQANRQPVRQTA
ncbi:MAG: deoxyribodipyrimidine photolyase [Chitinophagaceae bacterium]|nr:deoxyribodipyrimidine photolyase [Chitinophagaceae bacterium]